MKAADSVQSKSGGRVQRMIACFVVAVGLVMAPWAAHAADVSWTGPANGNWNVGENWSGGTVPLPADNVTISGANVAVTDARQIDGSLTLMDGARLSANGSGASFVATGATSINNALLAVSGGALMDLSGATELVWTLCDEVQIIFVDGADSMLDLSGVQMLMVEVPSCDAVAVSIFVGSGGFVDFGGLESITAPGAPSISVSLVLDGMINAPNLAAIEGPAGEDASPILFLVDGDSMLDLPALEMLSNATFTVAGGQVTADALTAADGCLFSVAGLESISLDALETLTNSNLTVSTGTWTLPELTFLSDTNVALAVDSALNVPKLATVEGTDAVAFFTAAGEVALDAPLFTSARNVAFAASLGATLDVSALRTYTWDLCEGGVPFTASGADTVLDASGLRSLSITNTGCLGLGYPTSVTLGGRVDLSDLATITAPIGQFVSFFAANPGSVIDLSALVDFNPVTVTFTENDGGQIIRRGGGGEGEGEGEGEGKLPGCAVGSSAGGVGGWGPGDTLLILGLLAAIGLGGRRTAEARARR